MNFASSKRLNIDDIKSIISTLSLQEQFNSFVTIVDAILCTDTSDNYWNLISKNLYKDDHEKILEFLSPGGQFINFLLKEMPIDKSINSFEFPVSRLSSHTRSLIFTNSAPIFISSKLQSKIQGSPNNVLLLNAFEYYMFSFFSYIYNPSVIRRVDWSGTTDSIYCQLVFRYLDMFLFNCGHSSVLMQIALQSRSRSSYNPAFSRSPNNSFPTFSASSPFHDSILGRSRFMTKESSSGDMVELYFTETIVQVINEFWLNFSTDSSVPNGSPMKVGLSAVPNISARPTVDQVCLVRVFLKHTYHFCYTNCISSLSPGSQIECEFLSKVNLYRQRVLPKFLIPRIEGYLQYCFTVWPADLSFKIVVETWLSAIQPWRYIDMAHHQPQATDHDNSASIIVAEEWHSFVGDNLGLYLTLLMSFCRRMARMDLSVLKNTQMLFRVAKVLSQTGLGPCMTRLSVSRPHGARQTPEECLWSEIRAQVSALILDISRTIVKFESEDTYTAKGWISSVWADLSSQVMPSGTDNPRRVASYLHQCRALLASVFEIEPAANVSEFTDRNDYLEYKHSQPEHVVTPYGSRLTDFGRFQVAHGLCGPLETHESLVGYYDRPVCSYEVGALVRACSHVSSLVMAQCQDQISAACVRTDILGRLCRYIFIGQRMPTVTDDCTDDQDSLLRHWVDAHPPILRIRALASKPLLLWSSILLLILSFTLDMGLVPLLLLSLLLYVVAVLIVVMATAFV